MSVEVNQTSARARRGAKESVADSARGKKNGDYGLLNGENGTAPQQHVGGLPYLPDAAAQEQRVKTAAQPSKPKGMSLNADTLPLLLLTLLAALTRFFKISHPDEVVFDEVHFGKFAAYYIRREYFFDVHPPFAKLSLAFAGWLAGFKGDFEFENIGDKYAPAGVPYIAMRALPALLGTIQIPLVYAIMRETGHATTIALFSACLLLFDNAHITQDRLILLDATLVFFVTFSIFCYVMFYKQRYNEFGFKWWAWLLATGFSLATTMSCKMVGLLTIMSIGCAVAFDLWNILDIRRGSHIRHVGRHFSARVLGLIVMPAVVYMFWFWVHFRVLTMSGTGDAFMTSRFQETLEGNPLLAEAREIHYYDRVVMKHKGTGAFLHSHLERYPLKYDDGRISSQGQQVTGYPFNDTNNIWQIVPAKPIDPNDEVDMRVWHMDEIRLLHVNSDSYLMAHDVASPLMATNEEITTLPSNDTSRIQDTLFEFQIDGARDDRNKRWQSKSTWFRLIHMPTRVSVWTHTETPLPSWGFSQQEVNGNKNALDKTALWSVDELYPDPTAIDYEERIKPLPPRKLGKMNFFSKFLELQMQMLAQNAHLTQPHPYASSPINWPFVLTGISFWTDNANNKQIYLVGNVASWWLTVLSVSVITGIFIADAMARRRALYPIEPMVRHRLLNTTGFFVMAWGWHYLPFFLMNRQLFLHHYLPAHVIACLVAGSALNFIGSETINAPMSSIGPMLARRGLCVPRTNVINMPTKAVAGVCIGAVVVVFLHLSPLTYGHRGLNPQEIDARKWLQWTLHFAK